MHLIEGLLDVLVDHGPVDAAILDFVLCKDALAVAVVVVVTAVTRTCSSDRFIVRRRRVGRVVVAFAATAAVRKGFNGAGVGQEGEHVVVLSAPAEVLVREAITADELFTCERCDATEQFNVRQSDNTMYMYVCVYMYGT